MTFRFTLAATATFFAGSVLAADVSLTPPAGGNVVINDASGTPALVVQPSQQVSVPGLPAAATYTDRVCHNASGQLGRCDAAPAGSSVLTSDWFTLPASVNTTIDDSLLRQTSGDIPAFTATALAQYEIHVYMTFGFGGLTVPLPYTSNAGLKVNTISYSVAPGKLYIMRFTHDNSASVPLSTVLKYRYVMTPRGQLAPAPTSP